VKHTTNLSPGAVLSRHHARPEVERQENKNADSSRHVRNRCCLNGSLS
jgi:hypothetical protein